MNIKDYSPPVNLTLLQYRMKTLLLISRVFEIELHYRWFLHITVYVHFHTLSCAFACPCIDKKKIAGNAVIIKSTQTLSPPFHLFYDQSFSCHCQSVLLSHESLYDDGIDHCLAFNPILISIVAPRLDLMSSMAMPGHDSASLSA